MRFDVESPDWYVGRQVGQGQGMNDLDDTLENFELHSPLNLAETYQLQLSIAPPPIYVQIWQ